MAMYVFAPAGPNQLQNNLMRIAIEYIGLQQPGIGSPWAKGKRYIKKAIPCSGRAIKRTSIVSDKYFNHDYNQYGTGVYYYHITIINLYVHCIA